MELLSALIDRLPHETCVLVEVQATAGSVPREVGTWMAVFPARLEDGSQDADADSDALPELIGTIGGGRLEFDAIREARQRLQVPGPQSAEVLRYPLGPALGQCCGGVVLLRFTRIDASESDALVRRLSANYRPVSLFGGGHVGGALARVLAPLPYRLTWIDSRDGVFPNDLTAGTHCEHSEPVQGAVASLASDSAVLIMSFSHAEDLDVLIACLQRQRQQGDLPFIGMIGSRTKWATFSHRLTARGFTAEELAQVHCPIGLGGIAGKEPEVIAVGVAAQLLQEFPVGGGVPSSSTPQVSMSDLPHPS
jgi:xanthine dehydrogenase accessory factor